MHAKPSAMRAKSAIAKSPAQIFNDIMKVTTDAEDVLKTIETSLIAVSRAHPEITNYTAMRAYEAAIAYYHDIARQQQPKPANLTGLDASAYQAICAACESRLGKPIAPEPGFPLLTAEDMVSCLRRLRKSVDFWNKQLGRRGYFDFVARFV